MIVFNFHHVEPEPVLKGRKHLTFTPGNLSRFIGTIRRLGLEVISMRDVLAGDGRLVQRPDRAVLTFDDGYESFFTHAAPVLLSEECPATVFVVAGRFGETNDWDRGRLETGEPDQLLSVEQAQSLAKSPLLTFGSHGLRHLRLPDFPEATVWREVNESHAILTRLLGEAFLPVLAYPWGTWDRSTLRVMEKSSYRFAFSTRTGRWRGDTPRYAIPRYSMYYRDGRHAMLMAKFLRHRIRLPNLNLSTLLGWR